MTKRWVNGHWLFDIDFLEYVYIPAGEYEEGASLRPRATVRVPVSLLPSLLEAALADGRVPTKIPQSRDEDLKIVHRLLDILDKKA